MIITEDSESFHRPTLIIYYISELVISYEWENLKKSRQ